MSRLPFASIALLLFFIAFPLVPASSELLSGQEPIPVELAEAELARSRMCVSALEDLAELESSLQEDAVRADRLNALGRAVSLEKRQDAEPLDASDPMEAAVAQWFTRDSTLASRYIQESDSTLLVQRDSARAAILGELRGRINEISGIIQGKLEEGAPVQETAAPCIGAILVRSAVLDECGSSTSEVCEAARAEDPEGPYRFVDGPDDLWDVEEYGPWSTPGPLRVGPAGELVGGNTSARARIGNVGFRLTLRPILRRRQDLTEEEIAEYETLMDSLDVTLDHPDFVMVPGIDLQGTLPPPLGGETHFLLHFGDLSGTDDVLWSIQAEEGGPLRAVFPASRDVLDRLRTGEVVSLSAILAPEQEGASGEAVFTLPLLQISQVASVETLLRYLSDGQFEADLKRLFPVGSEG